MCILYPSNSSAHCRREDECLDAGHQSFGLAHVGDVEHTHESAETRSSTRDKSSETQSSSRDESLGARMSSRGGSTGRSTSAWDRWRGGRPRSRRGHGRNSSLGRMMNVRPPRTWARQLNGEEEERQSGCRGERTNKQNDEEINGTVHQIIWKERINILGWF
jgi:hypothetical protein